MKNVTTKERGWVGHFVGAHSCKFHRNTLVTHDDRHIVVSTVGAYCPMGPTIEQIGLRRWYETMAFSGSQQGPYIDADVSREISIHISCSMGIYADTPEELLADVDNQANDMHDAAVAYVVANFDALYRSEQ